MQWSPLTVIHYAEAVGVTLEDSDGGWNTLVEFVQSQERQNQEEKTSRKSKRKGVRELNRLSCSINYDKAKAKEAEGKSLQMNGGGVVFL